MTFGYLGYIWALFGCAIVLAVIGASAVFLYAVGRARRREGEPKHTVDALPLRPPSRGTTDDAA